MTLNAVVLPAPFGPISPTISPASAVKETASSATMPPKRFETLSTSRRGKSAIPYGEAPGSVRVDSAQPSGTVSDTSLVSRGSQGSAPRRDR